MRGFLVRRRVKRIYGFEKSSAPRLGGNNYKAKPALTMDPIKLEQ
jgi:hypothetical protein